MEMEQVAGDSFAASAPAMDREIMSPALRRLLTHWEESRGGRAMPGRADLGDAALLSALRDLILFELSCANGACADSLAGIYGLSRGMSAPFHEVMRRGQPIYRRRLEGADATTVERLLLPLSRDGVRVDAILVGVERKQLH